MKAIKIIAVAIVAFAFLVNLSTVNAQEESVDKVILATGSNYPDAVVSSAVSEKLGIPVLLTESEELSKEVRTALKEFDPSEVIIVGGPAAISEEVENKLKEDYEVTRVWGMSKYGTALEVCEHFWPEGTEEAILVENEQDEERGNIMGVVRNLANGKPIIPIPKGEIPANVLNQLRQMEVQKVKIIGMEITEEMETNLSELGIEIGERIRAENEERLQERLQNMSMENIGSNDTLIAVAVGNFRHVISAPNLPQSKSYLVSSEEQIQELVDVVNDGDIKTVKVVGKPDLAEQIAEVLEEETDAEIDLVTKRAQEAIKQAVEVARERRQEFANKYKEKYQKWKEHVEKKQENIQNRVNQTLEKVNSLMEDYNMSMSDEIQKVKEEVEKGNYLDAIKKAKKLKNEFRSNRWKEVMNNSTAIRREIRQETQSLRERTRELSEISQEFGQQMKGNMTVKERLEVIQKFQERRMEKVRDIVQQASNMGRGSESAGKWIEDMEKTSKKE
ncbi:MAG: cell wall-binding repeat-containing protein [Candidatus Aenigmatarchaeota archaeon]